MLCKETGKSQSQSFGGETDGCGHGRCERGEGVERCGRVGRRMQRCAAGARGGCGAALCAPNTKQGCRRQPCLLSMLDSPKPIQFVFFGSRGLFPKKVPSGARGGASHIFLFPWSGRGAAPHIYTPHVGVRYPIKPSPYRVRLLLFFRFVQTDEHSPHEV